jgi:hypothetical protein
MKHDGNSFSSQTVAPSNPSAEEMVIFKASFVVKKTHAQQFEDRLVAFLDEAPEETGYDGGCWSMRDFDVDEKDDVQGVIDAVDQLEIAIKELEEALKPKPTWWGRLRCMLGIHSWVYSADRGRDGYTNDCKRCGKVETVCIFP